MLTVISLVVVWGSGNVTGSFNEVTPRWAQLILGWVTVFRPANHLGISPTKPLGPTQPPTLSGMGNEY